MINIHSWDLISGIHAWKIKLWPKVYIFRNRNISDQFYQESWHFLETILLYDEDIIILGGKDASCLSENKIEKWNTRHHWDNFFNNVQKVKINTKNSCYIQTYIIKGHKYQSYPLKM